MVPRTIPMTFVCVIAVMFALGEARGESTSPRSSVLDISATGMAAGFDMTGPGIGWYGGALGIGVRLVRWTGRKGVAKSLALESRNDILAYAFRPLLGIRIQSNFQPITPFFVSRVGVGFAYRQDSGMPVEPYLTVGGGFFAPGDSAFSLRFEINVVVVPQYITGVDYSMAPGSTGPSSIRLPMLPLEFSIGVAIRP